MTTAINGGSSDRGSGDDGSGDGSGDRSGDCSGDRSGDGNGNDGGGLGNSKFDIEGGSWAATKVMTSVRAVVPAVHGPGG